MWFPLAIPHACLPLKYYFEICQTVPPLRRSKCVSKTIPPGRPPVDKHSVYEKYKAYSQHTSTTLPIPR